MQRITRSLLILCLLCLTAPIVAQDVQFDPVSANKTLDQLNIQLSTEQLNVKHLQHAVNVLDDLQEQAKECVKKSKSEIESLNQQLTVAVANKLLEEEKYLQNKKNELEKMSSGCRLFNLRSQEVITAFSQTIQKFVTTRLLERSPPIWDNIAASPDLASILYEKFDWKIFWENSGVDLLNIYSLIALISVFFLGLLLAIRATQLLKRNLSSELSDELVETAKQSLMIVAIRYLPIFLPIALACLFMEIYSFVVEASNYGGTLCKAVQGYIVFSFALKLVFYPSSNIRSISGMPRRIAKRFVHRMQILAALVAAGYIGNAILSAQQIPETILQISVSFFIILLSISLITDLWSITQLPALQYKHRYLHAFISILLLGIVALILLAEIIGYHNLAFFVLKGVAVTFAATLVAWLVTKMVNIFFNSLLGSRNLWHQRLRVLLGVESQITIPEFMALKVIALLLIWIEWLYIVLRVWGLSEAETIHFTNALTDGFTLTGIEIIPIRIAYAVLAMCGLALLTRITRRYFLKYARFRRSPGGRLALATLIGYVGFSVSIILALLIAGVNFTGIAIIAGALSVGVGFGLQGIVNNFVSGLTLLLERPIRVGDRIIIGGEEGYVRDISIRATTIRTLARTDIIVPNADIIGSKVTNMMLKDQNYRLEVKVGVAYGSDTELVRETLMQVAKDHPEVISDDEKQRARVLFRSFGDSSLNFELWCIIGNVNLKNDVESDLHFFIDKAFRESGIEIAFPQQDLHVKDWPKKALHHSELE